MNAVTDRRSIHGFQSVGRVGRDWDLDLNWDTDIEFEPPVEAWTGRALAFRSASRVWHASGRRAPTGFASSPIVCQIHLQLEIHLTSDGISETQSR